MSEHLAKNEIFWGTRAVLLSWAGGLVTAVFPPFPDSVLAYFATASIHGIVIFTVVLWADIYRIKLETSSMEDAIKTLEAEIKVRRVVQLEAVSERNFHIDDTRSWS